MTAYYERYERVKGMASFLSDDRAVGPEDAAAAVEAQLAGDVDYRAQAFAFIEGLVCFQQSFSRRHIGTREKLFEQVAHQHRFGSSHRLLSVRSQQSFSRHGIARASAALLIWLNENVL